MSRSRWTRTVLVVTAPLAALGGCALGPGSGLSAGEARDALYEALDETEKIAGGDWENRDDPTPRGCVIPLWVDGQHYPALRLGAPSPDSARVVADVAEAWEEWGYRVEQTLVGDVVELQGRDSLGELMVFRASGDGMTLQGHSECRPR